MDVLYQEGDSVGIAGDGISGLLYFVFGRTPLWANTAFGPCWPEQSRPGHLTQEKLVVRELWGTGRVGAQRVGARPVGGPKKIRVFFRWRLLGGVNMSCPQRPCGFSHWGQSLRNGSCSGIGFSSFFAQR